MPRTITLRPVLAVLAVSVVSACGPGDGTLTAAIYGEAYIEEGIPPEVFVDGWSVTFDHFVISLGEMSWGREEGTPELTAPAFHAFDLVQPSGGQGQIITTGVVPGGAYPAVAYHLAPLPRGSTAGNAADAERGTMSSRGYSLYVTGTATKDARSMRLEWGFASDVRFGDCESTAWVDGPGRSQITIHSDHLFLDNLTSEEPNVTFDLMSRSDQDADGVLTTEEMDQVRITTLSNYQVGSKRLGAKTIETLGDFVRYLVTTIGHIDGEGHCKAL